MTVHWWKPSEALHTVRSGIITEAASVTGLLWPHTRRGAAFSERLLDLLQRHGGRIAVGSPRLVLGPVSVETIPGWWAAEATRLVAAWRPLAGQKEARTR